MELLNRADIIVFLFVIYFTCLGWAQGVLRFVLGFAALAISSSLALADFTEGQDLMSSLRFFIILTVILSFIAWGGLNLWNKKISKSKKSNLLSRLAGATIGLLWSFFFCITIMVVLIILPAQDSFWKYIKKVTRESYTYTLVEYRFLGTHPAYQMIKSFYEMTPSPDEPMTINSKPIMDIRAMPEYQAIAEDFRFQEILKDKKIKKYVEERNIAGLVASKKVQDLLSDKLFIKKFQDLYQRILKEGR